MPGREQHSGMVIILVDWATRSQAPKPANDEGTEKVQRLNGSGSEVIRHHQ